MRQTYKLTKKKETQKEGEEEKRGKGTIYTVKERERNKRDLREKLERKRENEQYKGYVTTRENQKEGKKRTRQKRKKRVGMLSKY